MAERLDRFFAWVWRLNGLLLLVCGLVGAAGALALISDIAFHWSGHRPQQQLTEVAGAELTAKDLRLADLRPVKGTQFLYAPLRRRSEYGVSRSGGSSGLVHNLLFFDITTKKAHWLLADNDQIIWSFSFLMDPPGVRHAYIDGEVGDRDQVAIALLVELESEKATAAAGDQSRSLAVAAADGRNLTPIAKSTGGLLGYHQPNSGSVLVFYVSDGAARVLDLVPTTRKVRSDRLVSTEE